MRLHRTHRIYPQTVMKVLRHAPRFASIGPMTRWLVSFALLIGAPVHAADPVGEVICAERSEMLRRLEVEYGATRQGRGLRGPDAVIEVWAVRSTGEWTLVQSYADGRACIIAMGENWEGENWEQSRPTDDPA